MLKVYDSLRSNPFSRNAGALPAEDNHWQLIEWTSHDPLPCDSSSSVFLEFSGRRIILDTAADVKSSILAAPAVEREGNMGDFTGDDWGGNERSFHSDGTDALSCNSPSGIFEEVPSCPVVSDFVEDIKSSPPAAPTENDGNDVQDMQITTPISIDSPTDDGSISSSDSFADDSGIFMLESCSASSVDVSRINSEVGENVRILF